MIKKSIHCKSCEVRCDVIVRQSNYDDEFDIEVNYCPVCSINLEDQDDYEEEYDE